MKFGLLFQLQDPPNGDNLPRLYDEVFAQAELAERVGFTAFFLPEHHQGKCYHSAEKASEGKKNGAATFSVFKAAEGIRS